MSSSSIINHHCHHLDCQYHQCNYHDHPHHSEVYKDLQICGSEAVDEEERLHICLQVVEVATETTWFEETMMKWFSFATMAGSRLKILQSVTFTGRATNLTWLTSTTLLKDSLSRVVGVSL